MLRPFLFAAVLGLCPPAIAGTHVTYAGETPDRTMTIEVADNGDARISDGRSSDYGLMLSGHFYVVAHQNGTVRVMRIEDVAAAIDQVIPPVFKGVLSGARPAPPKAFRAVKKGTRSVAGHAGTVYAIYGLDDAKPEAAQDFVMSDDPALKPVGAVLEQFMNAAIVPAAPLLGGSAADIIASTRAIFALGTPLDAGGRFRLTSLVTADVPPDRLALPAQPATVETLVSGRRAMQPKR
jgi:hypothetical protein